MTHLQAGMSKAQISAFATLRRNRIDFIYIEYRFISIATIFEKSLFKCREKSLFFG